ncbi:MAG: ABC transporter substrate-binding protein [Bacteroidia bacterium]|nr:ABC transporter substrate-binding protein [Bacteroidia bacterium]MDW8348587.1 ABC transporter substrate-binding protein [Bacteroidia bacterium]
MSNVVKIALDWTPNINHVGFFIAKELGFYDDKQIQIQIQSPAEDNYQTTPGKKLELGLVDFAIAPFETVISFNNKPNKAHFIAVFAILQEDLSCIVTLHNSGINSPKYLDGKTYASYKAKYEDHIVKQMVINDGGKGELNIIYPDKLGIWNTVVSGQAQATWIFDNWEGIEASTKNIILNKFRLKDYGIPYGYSPVIVTKMEYLINKREIYIDFIKATQKGYLYASQHSVPTLSILEKYLPKNDIQNIDLQKAFSITAPYFGNEQNCGIMSSERVNAFLSWLVKHNLESVQILTQKLFTNELIVH